jgi:ubiquitin C
MQIFVQIISGKSITIEVKASDFVATVKDKIREKLKIPPDDQVLIFDGKPLNEKKKISDYSIEKHSTVQVLVRLKGGVRLLISTFAFNSLKNKVVK